MARVANPFFKNRIMTTGPTPVPDFVISALSTSVMYHRGPAFSALMEEVRKLLPPVFGTRQEVLVFSGTGTLAMEGAIANFFNPGDEVISIDAGKFGSRWTAQAKIYGLKVHEIKIPRGEAVKVADVEKLLHEHPDTRGVLVHASETSTGVRHDVKAIAALARKQKDCLTVVDAVTAVPNFSLPTDEWGLDVVVGGSQKGFMLPPGVAFGTASERAWARAESVKNTRYYLDWRKEKKSQAELTGAFTSPVTFVGGLVAVLKYLHHEGLENVHRRGWKLAMATREAGRAMGFELLVKNDKDASNACTAFLAEGSYTSKIRDDFGLVVSGGQDELKGKIVRIGHIGFIDAWDVAAQLQAVALTARQLGKNVDMEAGLKAYFDVVASDKDYTPADLAL
jgi:aspartate aminotransferase-like enzyme